MSINGLIVYNFNFIIYYILVIFVLYDDIYRHIHDGIVARVTRSG